MSSSEEDIFEDVDSSFNQTLEDNTVEGAKRELKNRNNPAAVEGVTALLGRCKVADEDNYQLDGSTIVYVDSEEEVGVELEEVVKGHVQGGPEPGEVAAADEAVAGSGNPGNSKLSSNLGFDLLSTAGDSSGTTAPVSIG